MITFYTYIQSFNLETIYFFNTFLLNGIKNLLPFEVELFSLFEYLNLIFFTFSLSFLLKSRSGFSNFNALMLGLLITLSITYIGASFLPVVVFSPLIFLLSLRQYSIQNSGIVLNSILNILEIATYIFSNVLAFFYYAISRILYPSKLHGKTNCIIEASIAFISFYIFFYFSQFCHVFDYPKEARLFDLNSIQQMGEVVFGTERIPLTLIPEIFSRERLSSLTAGLLLFIPLILVISYQLGINFLKIKDSAKYFVSVLFLVILTTNFFDSNNYLLSPEGILYSIFPGLIWRVYPWFFVSLFFILYSICSLTNSNFSIKSILTYSIYFIMVVCFFERPPQTIFVTENDVNTLSVQHTPSSYLLEQYSLKEDYLPKKDNLYREVLELNTFCKIEANRNQNEIQNAIDNNIETVWRTKGTQNIGDAVTIYCNKNVDFDRILISTGASSSDFPRGFQIEIGEDANNLNVIKKLPLWLGRVEMTERNLPYFGPQHEEFVDFSEMHSGKVLKITLLRGSDVFDWSIAEIKFFGLP